MNDELLKEIMRSDEELAEAMEGLSGDESLAYYKSFYQRVLDDPDISAALPAEFLEQLRTGIESYEKSLVDEKIAIRNAEIADQNAAIARAEFNRVADQALAVPSDKKGN